MNNESKNTFSALTTANITALAASDNLDDNELAHRLGNRLVLEIKQARGVTLTADEDEALQALIEVTDPGLQFVSLASLNGEAA
jgi:hypothetical protein